MIQNFSKEFALRYYQTGLKHSSDLLNIGQSSPFAWTDCHSPHELEIDLFCGDLNSDQAYLL